MTVAGVRVSFYTIVVALLGVSGAAEAFVHRFGSSHLDVVLGSTVALVSALSIVAHVWLSTETIDVPLGIYDALVKINGALVGLLGAASLISQYVGSVSPSLTPIVSAIFAAAAIFVSLFAGLFQSSVSKLVAGKAHEQEWLHSANEQLERA